MRFALLIVVLAGCGNDGPSDNHHPPDGPPPIDANPQLCTAPLGTANVTLDDAGTNHLYGRLDGGGTWLVGPVAPAQRVAGAPMSIVLLFTNADPLDPSEALCCAASDSSCCHTDGVVVTNNNLPSGGELGQHAVEVRSFQTTTWMVPGTIEITAWQHPFDHAPGRIAGTVSAIANVHTVTGSFDDAFCQALLSVTI